MQKGSEKLFVDLIGVDHLVKIFSHLISIDTQSDPESTNVPSSQGQLILGSFLLKIASELGFYATQDKYGIISIDIPASKGFEDCKKLCLLAHMDTAPDCSGKNVKARLVKKYEGGDIELDNGLIINIENTPELKRHLNDDIIVTDGTTLLGADDKAGLSILLSLLHELKADDSIEHGPLKFVFSVDEEIGLSQEYLDPRELDCDYGVTIDGTALGELDIATFNAYAASVSFKGSSIHTGSAYKRMVNAIDLAYEFLNLLPRDEKPENTQADEGFFHAHDLKASVEQAELKLIIRDFSKDGMQRRLDLLKNAVDFMNQKYGVERVSCKTCFQYANMQHFLEKDDLIVKILEQSYQECNVPVIKNHVRGGTDGSSLSQKGLPTPNIFTGALNCHGPLECLPVNAFNKAYEITKSLIKAFTKVKKDD